MGTTRFNWENLRTWVKQAEEVDPPDYPGQKMQQAGSKKCKSCGAKMSGSSVLSECPKCADKKGAATVWRSELTKVGGLFRVRDDYETVWKMEAGEDGRSYICRVGEEGTDERFLVAEDDSEANYSKAAFRTLVAGQVHIVWECDSCNAPNITKEGNSYECDDCHKQYPQVLSSSPKPEVYDRSTAAQFGGWVVDRMKREGINKINRNLIEAWVEEKTAGRHEYDDEGNHAVDCAWCEKQERDRSHRTPSWQKEREDFHSDGSRKRAGAAPAEKKGECPDCGDVVSLDMREKHQKFCPGKNKAARRK